MILYDQELKRFSLNDREIENLRKSKSIYPVLNEKRNKVL